MRYNLLAYPRSGSSLTRVLLCYVTGILPKQPQGHCELEHICKDLVIPSNDELYKFHSRNDAGYIIPRNKNNTLLLLIRDPVENIPSFMFSINHSVEGINQKTYTDEDYKKFFSKISENTLNIYIREYKQKLKFYSNWKYNKTVIRYKPLINNTVEYIFNDLDRNIITFRRTKPDELFYSLANKTFSFKTSSNDPLKVNTSGNDFSKFRELIPDWWVNKLEEIELPT